MLCAGNPLNVTWHLVFNQAWVEKNMVMSMLVRTPIPDQDPDLDTQRKWRVDCLQMLPASQSASMMATAHLLLLCNAVFSRPCPSQTVPHSR